MGINMRREIPMPAWLVLVLSSITGLSWMFTAYLLGLLSTTPFVQKIASPVLLDLGEAVVIATSIGLFINHYLKGVIEPGPGAVLDTYGIQGFFSRPDAANEFLSEVRDPRNKTIWLIGISLRDFLMGSGALRNVWEGICQRLEEEEHKGLDAKDRLHVRILLLHPKSAEGVFRSETEKSSAGAGGLQTEVPIGMGQIDSALQAIFGGPSPYLQARLYEHCPFAFCFFSDNVLLLQQYFYRDHSRRGSFPLIKFKGGSKQYVQALHSYEKIWNAAQPNDLTEHTVGVAEAVRGAKVKNIYRSGHRYLLGLRQIECMKRASPTDVICIQAITGRFYMREAVGTIMEITTPRNDTGATRVKFLIINPVSQQAIIRAVADSCRQDEIGSALAQWTWERHVRSRLYIDAWQVIWQYRRLQEIGCNITLNLTPAPLTSSLLLTPGSAFVEQYVYGRSSSQEGIVLGAEYPVFEFESRNGGDKEVLEQQILRAAFDVMWNWFSIPIDQYAIEDEPESFRQNLELVRAYQRNESASQTLGQSRSDLSAAAALDDGGRGLIGATVEK